jgi:endoglucanase
MRRFVFPLALLLLLSACSLAPQNTPTPTVTLPPPPPTHTPTPLPPTPIPSPAAAGPIYESNYRIGRGVNLGNALEAPNEGEWGITLKEDYFVWIKEAGFDSVRVPIRFSEHALAEAPYTIDAEFFARIDWVVENAIQNDLVAILDMHHYLEIFQDPAAHSARFIALWQQIAERYQDQPTDKIYFELLNEPNTNLGGEVWNKLLADTLGVVRATNPDRPVIVAPGNWGGISELENLKLPDDPYLIVTVHYYSPFQFTHQGADWAGEVSETWLGTTWEGGTADRFVMNTDFSTVADWGRRNKRPIYLGEFGSFEEADMESRIRWTNAVARYAEQYGFPWTYWEFCAVFGVFDPKTETWREPLLKALLPEK